MARRRDLGAAETAPTIDFERELRQLGWRLRLCAPVGAPAHAVGAIGQRTDQPAAALLRDTIAEIDAIGVDSFGLAWPYGHWVTATVARLRPHVPETGAR